MGLYNFQPRFVPFILDGRKRHTIRELRANPDKPGNTCHLYTGLRQKGARLLFRAPCLRVEPIQIFAIRTPHILPLIGDVRISIDGVDLSESEREFLARSDGFEDLREMVRFWTEPRNRFPFEGHIIHWDFEERRNGRP